MYVYVYAFKYCVSILRYIVGWRIYVSYRERSNFPGSIYILCTVFANTYEEEISK